MFFTVFKCIINKLINKENVKVLFLPDADTMCRSLFLLLPFLASRHDLNKQNRFLQCNKEHGVESKGRSILKTWLTVLSVLVFIYFVAW